MLHRIATALAMATVAGFLTAGPALADGEGRHEGHEAYNVGGPYGVTYSNATDSGYKTGASYHHNRWFDLDD
ncbi:hypothetical protein [Streptomyces sp. KL118A]|uniref:hypothetical protein n=1 Tax=Streptomyces sp. KL118A TaxID=3045153 RepID=UPI00278C5443|nr:hypothetical protein [Streptomyces sp. KL118A]